MTVVTIGIVGIAAVLLALQLKEVNGVFGMYLVLASGCLIFSYGISKMESILDALRRLQQFVQISPVYLTTLLKMTGIIYVAEFASGICRDAGYSAIASQIEVFGKLSILAVSMPIMLALMETLQGFLA